MSSLEVIVLAAGQGRRMASSLPKVLHPLAGRALLAHVLTTAEGLAPRAIHVVYGHGGDAVRTAFADAEVQWVRQEPRRGTGDAVRQALAQVGNDAHVVVLLGDVPLLSVSTVRRLCAAAAEGLALLTFTPAAANEYGRIVRDDGGAVERIVEWRDATAAQRTLTEANSGIVATTAAALHRWLPQLSDHNAQGEFYLTDIVALARAEQTAIAVVQPDRPAEVWGVNCRADLAMLERIYQADEAARQMAAGVHLADPARFDVRGRLQASQDVMIDVNCVFEGAVVLDADVVIGPHCLIRNSHIRRGARIEGHSVIDGATVGEYATVGPFARLRPGTQLAAHARIGNFVETKAAVIGARSKISHLSYIGDSQVGCDVNVGAGVITCNYDGAHKHRTVIGDGAFVGSNSQLVAPVEIGAGATIGAGSTITKDAPAGELTLSRPAQKTVFGWKRPTKSRR
ncbi:MAG: bifunctional UDP-N-acetylglucosamine diphosphorylase/glucosamine-1-phosphate N-acetyltransferase GlmU [Acidiferrobacter sp.]